MSEPRIPNLPGAAALLLGQPCEIMTWYPTAIIRCKCSDTTLNMLILTPSGPAECSGCRRRYAIGGIGPNGPEILTAPPSLPV